MHHSEFLADYEVAEPAIRKLYDSRLRLAILDALREGPMRLADLRRAVNANAPNTSAKAKELEEMGTLERVDGDFKLTPYGKVVLENLTESIGFYATYGKFKEFWGERDLNGIPQFLLKRLNELSKSEIITNNPTNVKEIDDRYYELLRKSKFAHAILPILDPEWIILAIQCLEKNVKIKIVGTPSVMKGVIGIFKDGHKEAILKRSNLELYELAGIPILSVVTDRISAINLRLKSAKTYQQQEVDLLSFSPRAIQWGLDLFEYYKKQAKPVKLSDYV